MSEHDLLRVIRDRGASQPWSPGGTRQAPPGRRAPGTTPAPEPTPAIPDPAQLEAARAEGRAAALAEAEATLAAERARHADELARIDAAAAAEVEQLRHQVRRLTSGVKLALTGLRSARAEATLALEPRLTELALEVARRAVDRSRLRGEHDVARLVERVLSEARRRYPSGPWRLHLHPDDAALLDATPEAAEVVPDPELNPGDARVETDEGWVWDGIGPRLEALAQALLGDGQEPDAASDTDRKPDASELNRAA